eukprot:s2545_g1.t1
MSLASRVDRVLSQSSPDSLEMFKQKSLEEMGTYRMAFGKVLVGKLYLEVWQNEKTWVKWFCRIYGDSQKEEHPKMLHFVEKMVQQHEQDHGLPDLTTLEMN